MSLRPFAVVTIALLALAACSTDAPGTDRSSGASSSADQAADPAEALGRAGLALPSEATDASLEVADAEDADEAYAVTFQLPRSQVEEFCSSGGLGGSLPAVTLNPTHEPVLGTLPVSGESRSCDAVDPDNPSWWRYVLVDPGDPATVHISLMHVPR